MLLSSCQRVRGLPESLAYLLQMTRALQLLVQRTRRTQQMLQPRLQRWRASSSPSRGVPASTPPWRPTLLQPSTPGMRLLHLASSR